jgi:D-sedoheptulose 7-phosphate isomerase
MSDRIVQALLDLADTARATAASLEADITSAAEMIRSTIASGRTLFFCGNGGSAADAQHLATEYVVRYLRARRAVAAIALTTDSSLLTAAANDLGFEQVFARQLEALARPGDLLIIHSTSGESPNVLRAAETAHRLGARVLAFSARGGGALRSLADLSVVIPTQRTDRAQELHLCIEHAICELIEREL